MRQLLTRRSSLARGSPSGRCSSISLFNVGEALPEAVLRLHLAVHDGRQLVLADRRIKLLIVTRHPETSTPAKRIELHARFILIGDTSHCREMGGTVELSPIGVSPMIKNELATAATESP